MNHKAPWLVSLGFILVLSVFLSYWSAISRAKSIMAPALDEGWYHFETQFQPLSPRLGKPAWWVRFDHRDEMIDFPPSISVSFFGGVSDTVEVDALIDHYKANRTEGNSKTN